MNKRTKKLVSGMIWLVIVGMWGWLAGWSDVFTSPDFDGGSFILGVCASVFGYAIVRMGGRKESEKAAKRYNKQHMRHVERMYPQAEETIAADPPSVPKGTWIQEDGLTVFSAGRCCIIHHRPKQESPKKPNTKHRGSRLRAALRENALRKKAWYMAKNNQKIPEQAAEYLREPT